MNKFKGLILLLITSALAVCMVGCMKDNTDVRPSGTISGAQSGITSGTNSGAQSGITSGTISGEQSGATLSFEQSALTLRVGDTRQLNLRVLPVDVADKSVIWTSTDHSVVTVKEGKVTATGQGNAIIKACSNGEQATCEVTVTDNTQALRRGNGSMRMRVRRGA